MLPRFLHGLEAAVISQKDLDLIDNFYRGSIHQIQSLPTNAAKESIYLIVGTLPAEAHLHMRILSMVGRAARLDCLHPLRQLALRQLSVRVDSPRSWFSYAATIGHIYSINIFKAILYPWSKQAWKQYYKATISQWWLSELQKKAEGKTSLDWLLPRPHMMSPHLLWQVCQGRPYLVEAASTRVRMLAGRYRLQTAAALYSKHKESSLCPLCEQEDEDIIHLLVLCPKLEAARENKLRRLTEIYLDEGVKPPESPYEMCSALLNGNSYTYSEEADYIFSITSAQHISTANSICNILCHKLHTVRDILINQHLDK